MPLAWYLWGAHPSLMAICTPAPVQQPWAWLGAAVPGPRPSGSEWPNTHVVLRQLVDGHLGLQQVAVEGNNLMAQRSLLLLIVLALGWGGGSRRRWSAVSQGLGLKPNCSIRPSGTLAAGDDEVFIAKECRGKSRLT